MMRYPYIAYSPQIDLQPIFKDLKGNPFVLDMSDTSPIYDGMDVRDQETFQHRIDELMAEGHFSWGVASYLENRKKALSSCPQMVEDGRFYHLGLDLIVPLGTLLHAPLFAVVKASGYEAGDGNYGAYVLLEHTAPATVSGPSTEFETFYSFYGHLNREALPGPGERFEAGEPFAKIGDFFENGNWFYHTHLQILTSKAYETGYISKGYCAASDLAIMDSLCPSPLSLFRT